ncbi:MAG: hypothetical protein R3A80_12835 [Bdellovibrionota bacterium]
MKKIFVLTMIALFAVACGKSSGGGSAATTPGTYTGTTPGNPGEPIVEFTVSMDICSKGALQIRPGTRMGASSAQDYFRDYFINADYLRDDIARVIGSRYDPYYRQTVEVNLGPATGIEIANGHVFSNGY